MGGGGWLTTTTAVNVMLMGDDGVDDVTDFFCPLAWATCIVRFAAARRAAQSMMSQSTLGALAVPGARVRTSPVVTALPVSRFISTSSSSWLM